MGSHQFLVGTASQALPGAGTGRAEEADAEPGRLSQLRAEHSESFPSHLSLERLVRVSDKKDLLDAGSQGSHLLGRAS